MELNTTHIKTDLDYYWKTIDTINNVKNNLITYYIHNENNSTTWEHSSDGLYSINACSIPQSYIDYIVNSFTSLDKILDINFQRVFKRDDAIIKITHTENEIPGTNMEDAYGAASSCYSDKYYDWDIGKWRANDLNLDILIKNTRIVNSHRYYDNSHKETIIHEIGHVLTLEHPFEDNDGDVYGDEYGINAATNYETVLAYENLMPDTKLYGHKTWYTDLDIQALKEIWGENFAPTNWSVSSTSFNENIASGSTVATLSGIDEDSDDTHTFKFTSSATYGPDNNKFSIEGNQLKINESPDYELKNTYTISFEAIDSSGLSSGSRYIELTVNDIEDEAAPVILTPSSENYEGIPTITINENITAVHIYSADKTVTWSLDADPTSSTDYTLFSINSTTGALSFKNAPDHENPTDSLKNNIYALKVKATDSSGNTSDQRLWIYINNVNEAPTDLKLISTSFNENIAESTIVSAIASTDDDTSDPRTYSLVSGNGDTDNSLFTIYKPYGITYLRINSSPDYETKSSYNIRLQVTDSGGNSNTKAFTLSVNDLNETPTALTLSTTSFNENIDAASTVATLSTTDVDSEDTHTYSLVSGTGDTDNDSFTIDGSSLKIKSSPDYENKSSYIIRLLVTDSGGETYAKAFTLSVNDFSNEIQGTNTNDNLINTVVDQYIDGLNGTDTLVYSGKFSNYTFTRSSNFITTSDKRIGLNDGTDTLKNIEYIQFTDQTVEESKVDIVKTYSGEFSDYKFYNKGNGIYQIKTDSGYDDITGLPLLNFTGESTTSSFRDISAIVDIKGTFDQVTGLNTDDAKMFRLYNAAFKRLPDSDGLKYWIGKYTSGENDDRAVALSFLVSAEFKQRYGEDVTNAKYVETLYVNVLGRDYDQSGYNYWLGNLNSGLETRYELLLGFAESAENKALFTEMTGFG